MDGHHMISKIVTTSLLATTALATIAISHPANAQAQREQARTNFLKADVNQDRQLDFAEFTTFINLNADHGLGRADMIRRFGMHGKAFGRLDANRDGVVTKNELAQASNRRR
jgi:Ca2+-binding EF-hand superfamily protein